MVCSIRSHIPEAIETGNGRCDSTVARRNDRDSQGQNRHVEQNQHISAERVSKTTWFQAIPNQRLPSLKLGRQQRQGIISTLHVRLASVVRRRRNDACPHCESADNSTLLVDCSEMEFTTMEASLYQVLHRTTKNEPLIIVQQTKGQKGFEAWHAIVRRYGQRNMSDTNSA